MANVELKFEAGSNLPEVLAEDEAALRKQQRAHEKAQKEIAKIIARGDPLKALEQQKERELKALERAAARSEGIEEDVQKARLAIVERYEKRRTALIEVEAKRQAAALDETSNAIAKMKTPVRDVTGLIGRLGGQASGAVGKVGQLGSSLLTAFGSGGLVALGIAGVGAGVGFLVSEIQESKRVAEEAAQAQAEAWSATRAEVVALNDALREKLRLEGQAAVGATPTGGEAAVGAARQAVNEQEIALRRIEKEIAERQAQQNVGIAAFEKRDRDRLAAEKREIEREIKVRRDDLREAEALAERERMDRSGPAPGDPTAGLPRPSEVAALQGRASRTSGPSASSAAAEAKAAEREAAQAAARASTLAREARMAVEDALAGDDLIEKINLQTRRALDALAARAVEAEALAQSTDAQTAADALAALELLEQEKTAIVAGAEAQRAAVRTDAAAKAEKLKADEKAAAAAEAVKDDAALEAQTRAGMQSAAAFGQGFKSFLDSSDPKDLFRGILGAAAGIFSIFDFGLTSSALGIIGGFFRDGGPPFAHRLPQGRRGLATMGPGLNNDGLPSILHPREIVIPEDVIAEDLGGMPEAMRLAGGKGLPSGRGGGGGGDTYVLLQAYDSVDGARALARQEGAKVQRMAARQGGMERASSMGWLQPARSR